MKTGNMGCPSGSKEIRDVHFLIYYLMAVSRPFATENLETAYQFFDFMHVHMSDSIADIPSRF